MFDNLQKQELKDLFHEDNSFFKEEKKELETKPQKNLTFWLAIFLLLIIVSPLLLLGVNLFSSYINLRQIKKAVSSADFRQVKLSSENLTTSFAQTEKLLQISGSLLSLFGLEEKISQPQKIFLLGKSVAESLYQTSILADDGKRFFKKIFSADDYVLEEDLSEFKLSLGTAFEKTSVAQSFLSGFSGREIMIGSSVLQAKKLLPELRRILLVTQEVVEILPEVLGNKGRRTYLVLFQNNMEIRPGGGFIGSYGILTFEKGKLMDFEIQDVYFADGQLKGHVEPPLKLKEYLGQATWYLRDSNWDPDFPTSAQRAEWFLDKETGRKVDGVIAINLTVTQKILEAVGEIQLPDYQEKINAKNFFERAEYWSEAGFFPGSTGKKDFLGQVGRILFQKIKEGDEKTLALVGRAIFDSLEKKDVLLYFNEARSASLMQKFNWDGGLKKAKCQGKNGECLNDYLMIVEANVGVNKSNYFLTRSIDKKIEIASNGKITSTVIINYENKSPSSIFPAGNYKTYLRLLVPQGSLLNECKIDKDLCTPEQTIDHQRDIFGFLVNVPVGEKRRVEISWFLPMVEPTKEYLLHVQKQSGMPQESFNFSLIYPQDWRLVNIEPATLTSRGQIIYNTTLASDLFVRANFVKP